MAELRDPKETGAHVNRVGAYSAELYEHWAMKNDVPKNEIKQMKGNYRLASMLHDVGKVGISDIILKKPGPFTDEERKLMHSILYLAPSCSSIPPQKWTGLPPQYR